MLNDKWEKRTTASQDVGRSSSSGLLCLHLLGSLLLLAVLRLVVVLVLVLRVLLLLGGGLGHKLFESHEIALFLGVSCCLDRVVSIEYESESIPRG